MTAADAASLVERVRIALDELDPLDRSVVRLVYFGRRTYAQAATTLATTPTAVNDSLVRAYRVVCRVVERDQP